MALQFDARQYFPAPERANGEGQTFTGGHFDCPPRPDSATFDRFLNRLQQLQKSSTSATQLLKGLAEILSAELSATGVWLAVGAGGAGGPQAESPQLRILSLCDQDDNPLWPLVGKAIEECSRRALQAGQPVIHDLSHSIRLAAVRLSCTGQAGEALAVCFPGTASLMTGACLALVSAAVIQWRTDRLLEISGEHAQTANRMLGLCKSVVSADSVDDACIAVANQLAVITGATQVCILTSDVSRGTSVRAVSGVESFDSTSSVIRAAVLAGKAEGETGRCLFWQEGDNELDQRSPLAAYVREISARSCASVSVKLTDETSATCLFSFANVFAESGPCKKRIEQVASIVGGQMGQCVRLHASPARRLLTRWKARLRDRLVRNLLIGAAALVVLLLCPVPYRVSCETRLEPVSRRFVAAPFDATLERTLAKNGDPVRAGELVAILDGRELRLQHSALQAELAAAKKRHDSTLATGDIAGAQVARSEAKKAEAELELLEQHLGQLEVRAPVDGIIVSGDLDTAQGIKLTTGQTLFEIGPLDRVRAEILIPDSELRHVRPEALATIWLASWPFQSWSGTICKIHQRSEIVDDQNCFVAEMEIDNPDGRLRPGMRGQARIQSGWRTLGWVWTHRAWERMRYLMVW